MKRIQLFEFEDFEWFPKTIRSGMTNLLVVLHNMMGTEEVLSNLIISVRKKHPFAQIVDLGSGSGGIMPNVVKTLNQDTDGTKLELLLTDLHPNQDIVKQFNKLADGIRYHETSLNAANFSELPKGLKTMVNSFHHMPPNTAKTILKSAQDNNQPLLIYEIGENKMPIVLWWLLLPISLCILFIMALFMTPFVKPLSWQQLALTYIIPVIPLCYAWDGQASLVRMYTFKDIDYLLNDFKNNSYTWQMAQAKKANGKPLGYYVYGLPQLPKSNICK